MAIPFDNTYAELPARFYAVQTPRPVAAPSLIRVNHGLAGHLGIDPVWLESAAGVEVLAGNVVPEGAAPISQAYAGHQFGGFVPQLGDGRAVLLGEILGKDGRRYDLQLKGSGPTPFSRRGDGRSALGPVLREYVVSEAMHALGVPTTRALAAVATGEDVVRETMRAGGVFTRVASSHLRVGTFQYFAALQDTEALQLLTDYAIARHYPEVGDQPLPAIALLEAVIEAQAALVCKWLGFGFIHGVMNTDNCTISGETIDYGPCAFMESFHPQCVFSSIDQHGRYAWGNQSQIAFWNLTRFAETLLPLIDENMDEAISKAEQSLNRFGKVFEAGYVDTFASKLGLDGEDKRTPEFIKNTFDQLAVNEIDYTLFFRQLTRVVSGEASSDFIELWKDASRARDWLNDWSEVFSGESRVPVMQAVNPVRIPRNHQVERAIQAGYAGDFEPFHRLVDGLAHPFVDQAEYVDLEAAARPEERVLETFCGT